MQKPTLAFLPSLLLYSLNVVAAFALGISQRSRHSFPADALALLAFKSEADLGNQLRFSPPSAYCDWQGVKCVRGKTVHLVIEGIALGGVINANSLTQLDQLRVLSLQNDSLTGPIPDLSGLFNLKTLFLDHNSFSDNFPPSISSLHRLRTLDLSYNNLTGPLPFSLASIDRLYYLRLERNRFNGTIPPFNQTSLQDFNVSGNNLSGAVPVTPTLLRFGASSFSSNPRLCGEIVGQACSLHQPFFESTPAEYAPRPPAASGLNARIGDPAGENLVRTKEHKRVAAIIGLSTGVVVLVASLAFFAVAVKKQRRNKMVLREAMASDSAAAAEAAAVMRIEEENELGEKVKAVQQQGSVVVQAGKSGSLLFCAGEAQVYSLDQLMRASAELLGRGTMGTTYKAVLDNRLIVCVKRLDVGKTAVTGEEVFQRHMESVGGLRHPNLVPLRAYFQAKEERLLIYDYQPNGSLFSLIHGSKSARAKPLHWTSCLKIAEDVAQGLSYIHQAWRLVHGNLKSTNVLLGSDFEACLTDYCLAALAAPYTANDDPDSIGYRAPETRRPDRPTSATSKSDVYAFGVLLLELLTGMPPSEHPRLMPGDLTGWVRSVRQDRYDVEEGKMGLVLEVAVACSVTSPEQRPTMWQVLKMIHEIKEAVLMEDNELLDPPTITVGAYS